LAALAILGRGRAALHKAYYGTKWQSGCNGLKLKIENGYPIKNEICTKLNFMKTTISKQRIKNDTKASKKNRRFSPSEKLGGAIPKDFELPSNNKKLGGAIPKDYSL